MNMANKIKLSRFPSNSYRCICVVDKMLMAFFDKSGKYVMRNLGKNKGIDPTYKMPKTRGFSCKDRISEKMDFH